MAFQPKPIRVTPETIAAVEILKAAICRIYSERNLTIHQMDGRAARVRRAMYNLIRTSRG